MASKYFRPKPFDDSLGEIEFASLRDEAVGVR